MQTNLAGGYDDDEDDDAAPHRNAIKVTFVDCSSSTPSSRCHSRVMRDGSARQRQGSVPPSRDSRRFHYPLWAFGTLPDLRVFSAYSSSGPLLYERGRTRDSVPIKARDANSLATSSRTYRMIIIYAPSEALAAHTRDSYAISTFLLPVPSDPPLALRVWTPYFPPPLEKVR